MCQRYKTVIKRYLKKVRDIFIAVCLKIYFGKIEEAECVLFLYIICQIPYFGLWFQIIKLILKSKIF